MAGAFPLELRTGRSINHSHAFYDHGRVLPALARRKPGPQLWISPADAAARGIADGAAIRIHNERGECRAGAHVTDRVPDGTVWMHDGWKDLNTLTSGGPSLPDSALGLFPFTVGQAAYDARVDVAAVDRGEDIEYLFVFDRTGHRRPALAQWRSLRVTCIRQVTRDALDGLRRLTRCFCRVLQTPRNRRVVGRYSAFTARSRRV